jgi:AAA ATPase domain
MTVIVIAQALRLASVSGSFDPMAMARALGLGETPAHRDAVWRQMSSVVTEVVAPVDATNSSYHWVLKPDNRREQLASFVSVVQLDQAMAAAPAPTPTDLFGKMLRRVLSRKPVSVTSETIIGKKALLALINRHAAMLDAAQFAEAVPALDQAAIAVLIQTAKQHIQSLQRRRDLAVVLPRSFFGYAGQRRRLSDFLRAKTDDPRPMLITGPGGVGKSALLARLQHHWQGRVNAPIAIALDFDRRQLNAGEPVEIMQEFLRQLETGLAMRAAIPPVTAAALRDLRHSLPKFTDTGTQRTHASQLGYLTSATLNKFTESWAEPLQKTNIALFLDSFEAVNRAGGVVVELILDLEVRLRNGGLPLLRTVVSARAEPLAATVLFQRFGDDGRQLRLSGVSASAGEQLLAAEDAHLAAGRAPILTSRALRMRISRVLGGHPLALIIFAKYARNHKGTLHDLVDSLADDSGFNAEFAQVFLYERILDRIDDPLLRNLAHPGLVLRRLNEDLLRFVLAGPCLGRGMDSTSPLTETQSAQMMTDLREQYWLVEDIEGPFPLRHRPDLRRLMIQGLFAGPRPDDLAEVVRQKTDLRDRAVDVCVAAAEYFAKGPPDASGAAALQRWQALGEETRTVERLYYLSFTQPTEVPEFELATAAAMDLQLDEDINTMPTAWRARIGGLLGHDLTDEEGSTLTGRIKESNRKSKFTKAAQVGVGQTGAGTNALSMAGAQPALAHDPSAGIESIPDIERHIETLFAAADFAAIGAIAADYLRLLPNDTETETLRRFQLAETDGYWRHPLWKCLLVAGAGISGADQMQIPASDKAAQKMLYGPVYRAILSALAQNPEGVSQALAPIFERDLLSPIDFNRVRGPELAARLRQGTAGAMHFYPSAFCLGAGQTLVEALSNNAPDENRLVPLSVLLAPLRDSDVLSLEDLGKMYSSTRNMRDMNIDIIDLTPDLRRALTPLIRGTNPELQVPLVALIAGMQPADAAAIANGLAKVAPLWPSELRFANNRGFRDVQSATVTETADQFGHLRQLASMVAEQDPRAAPIVAMYDCISQWFFPFAIDPA